MQENRIGIDFGWKSFISFFGSRPQARTCEKFWKKMYPWISTNFMLNRYSRPWKRKTNRTGIDFGWKSSIYFFGLKDTDAALCQMFWKKYILKIKKLYVHLQKRDLKMQDEQNWIRFWLKKFPFNFCLLGHRRGLANSSEKNILWKSINFMFNSNSRPWKCKRKELELILVEKVSFHFLAQAHRRGPVKKSEKNIFWKSHQFYVHLQ